MEKKIKRIQLYQKIFWKKSDIIKRCTDNLKTVKTNDIIKYYKLPRFSILRKYHIFIRDYPEILFFIAAVST